MNRGEIWTVSGGPDYLGKPRPAVIIQSNRFNLTDSITICIFTSADIGGSLFRVNVTPSLENGLTIPSYLMVDKMTSVPRRKLGYLIGTLGPEEMDRLDRAIVLFLGLAPRSS